MSFVQTVVQKLIRSLGLKRKLTNLFQVLAVASASVPALAAFGPNLQAVASWLGLVAITHAVAAKTFNLNIHSVAAFFAALLLAAKDVPILAPYAGLIAALAAVLGTLSTVSFLSRNQT